MKKFIKLNYNYYYTEKFIFSKYSKCGQKKQN